MEFNKKVPLTDLLEFIVDNRGKTVPTSKDGYKLIATNCIRNENLYPKYEKIRYCSEDTYNNWFRSHPKSGDIIFVNKGTPGRVCLVPDPVDFCIAQDMMAFRVKERLINNHYLLAVLRSKDIQSQIKISQVGTIIPHFKKEQLRELLIPLPDKNTQIRIGNFYYKISKKIELNNQINDNLHEIVNLIYKKMFSNKDKLEFDCLKNHASCILGGTPSRNKVEFWNGNINWINSGEVNKFRILVPSETITELGLKKSSTVLLPKDTTVLAITGATLGQVSRLEIDSCANQSVVGVVANKDLTNNYIYLTILNNIEDIIKNQTGGAQQHINKRNVEDFKLYIPTVEELNKFEERVKPFFEEISYKCKENITLEKIRDIVLPKLMDGEIDLDKIEIK